MSPPKALFATTLASITLMALSPAPAEAFCGFYVSGADGQLFANATQVVLMREGTRTVLSMQNNYEGPPSDFAMVIPVPVVLQKENVKTLSKDIFDRVDKMAAPRLVEYWEVDPCAVLPDYEKDFASRRFSASANGAHKKNGAKEVKIEAQFEVGEYEIVILSANDSGALDAWLRSNKYNIPQGAEPVLRPYVEAGTKFFVARVNAKKVTFEGNKALLSPLRFFYDSKDFSLPIRLGMLNASGHQDLIVHILARNQRYEVANYKNVTIPTNIGVGEDAKSRFGEFYAALFDRTLAQNPGSVVTEYAWDASSCDPCPGPTLNQNDFMTLGADATPSKEAWGFVLTRLHARYTKEQLGEDLVFKAASPIAGGREWRTDKNELEQGSSASPINNFQGRYAIRHPWKGEIKCENPVRGRWGGPSGQLDSKPGAPQAAQKLAEVTRGKLELPSIVTQDIPEIGLKMAGAGGGGAGQGDKTDGEVKPDGEVKDEGGDKVEPGDKKPELPAEKGGEVKAEAPKDGEAPAAAPSTESGCSTVGGSGFGWSGIMLLIGVGVAARRRRRAGL